jgi:hypothetical protein
MGDKRAMAMRPPAGPLISPDGRFYWDGAAWRPVAEPPATPAPQYYPAPAPQPQPYYAPQMPVAQPQPYYPAQPQPVFVEPMRAMGPARNGAGTTAGVLGIIAIILIFIPFADYIGIVLGVLAVIFGGVGISRANRMGGTGKGMAVTGLVLGLIAVIGSIIFIALVYAYLFRGGALVG